MIEAVCYYSAERDEAAGARSYPMSIAPRPLFLASGSVENWMRAKTKRLWGLSHGRQGFNECRAVLQEIGFGSGVELVACAGPLALFRAVVDMDKDKKDVVFYDDTPIWRLDDKKPGELWPVRFRFTRITEINQDWYIVRDRRNWRDCLRDVYPPKPWCLYKPREDALQDPRIAKEVLFRPLAASAPPQEDRHSAPEADSRRRYPAELRADDGHFVRSKSELTICNWLHHHDVPHAYERRLPIPEDAMCDFHIDLGRGCYIEHWGLISEAYQERRREKVEIYRRHDLNLVELEEADIARLDDVLPRRLRQFGIEVR